MLTLHVPMLLALLGTALMAIVIFAPAPVAATVTASFAQPPAPPPVEFWSPLPADPFPPLVASAQTRTPTWPALVDSRATSCDVAARLALVDALATVRTPWADAILHRALDDEPDDGVRDAIAVGLAS